MTKQHPHPESSDDQGDESRGVIRIGLISDTHGLLRPEALSALNDSDLILHAGDVGRSTILDQLKKIAPVHAVRGNVDHGPGVCDLPMTEAVAVGGKTLYLIHIKEEIDLDPESAGIDAVITGHTHQPLIELRGSVLHINPGSAGPRRFDLPISLAQMTIEGGRLEARIVELVTT